MTVKWLKEMAGGVKNPALNEPYGFSVAVFFL